MISAVRENTIAGSKTTRRNCMRAAEECIAAELSFQAAGAMIAGMAGW